MKDRFFNGDAAEPGTEYDPCPESAEEQAYSADNAVVMLDDDTFFGWDEPAASRPVPYAGAGEASAGAEETETCGNGTPPECGDVYIPPEELLEPMQALTEMLGHYSGIDMKLLSRRTGCTVSELSERLRGIIIRDPRGWSGRDDEGFVERSAYLSGNLNEKLNEARLANEKYGGLFEENLKALESVMSDYSGPDHSYVLGMPSIPPMVITKFILRTIGPSCNRPPIALYYKSTGLWKIGGKSRQKGNTANTTIYGIPEMDFLTILERTLNSQDVEVTKVVKGRGGKPKYVVDEKLTRQALEKQRRIMVLFDEFVKADPHIKAEMDEAYEKNFCCIKARHYDGSSLELPGMNGKIRLRPHQLDDTACILLSPNTLLCGEVGTGKTYTMIAAGHELRRYGLAKKIMYVVPNPILSQWKADFERLYPGTKLLTISSANFGPKKRRNMLLKVLQGDYDAVLITYTSFARIPMSRSFRIEQLEEAKSELLLSTDPDTRAMKSSIQNKIDKIDREINRIRGELSALLEAGESEDLCFDHLGIDMLFVDEAHNFKNISIKSRSYGVRGISRRGSARCDDMLEKVHFIQGTGRGAVFATATPISNSVTDVYVMQTYLQRGQLKFVGIADFDSWVSTFAEKQASLELDIDGCSYKTVERILSFRNLSELAGLFGQISRYSADEIFSRHAKLINVELPCNATLKEFIMSLSRRAEDVHSGAVTRDEDNMLKITIQGRSAALDCRLVGLEYDLELSKVHYCAQNVCSVWKETADRRLTQLVFCDTSTPKDGFNIYSDLRSQLVSMGIPSEEIAFIHDAVTDSDKDRLFEKVNNGDVRVLIGSTQKLGTGVNVQRLLCAVHHLSIPWKPSDMVQREGRMLRQGNECEDLRIFRYVTKGSFDAVSWQILERKQLFIAQFMNNTLSVNDFSFEETALSYAEVKALAVGDPEVRERIQNQNELHRLRSLQRIFIADKQRMFDTLETLNAARGDQLENIRRLMKDIDAVTESEPLDPSERRALGEELLIALEDNVMRKHPSLFGFALGLEIHLPADMTADNPYVILQGAKSYIVPMGGSLLGNVARIENTARGLTERRRKAVENLEEIELRRGELQEQLDIPSPYSEQIIALAEKLDEEVPEDGLTNMLHRILFGLPGNGGNRPRRSRRSSSSGGRNPGSNSGGGNSGGNNAGSGGTCGPGNRSASGGSARRRPGTSRRRGGGRGGSNQGPGG